jgi:selenide,water dikinase
MGAEVKTALNIVGFDGCNHTKDVLKEILDGGYNKVKECGGIIVGGHTIETPEMVYGLSVTGIVNNKYYQNNTVRQNDILILTKPIGMGVLTTAIKADMLEKSSIKNISDILAQLNYKASTIFKKYDVSAVTDVTGFGLAGHSYEMVKNTNFSIEFDLDNIPFLKDAIDMANMGIIPAGTYNNKSYLNNKVINLTNNDDILFYDAQTSGGLLIAVSQNDALNLVKELQNEGYEYSAIIGTITKEKENKIYLK